MKNIIFMISLFFIMSCENKVRVLEKNYDTGELKTRIYLKDNDTLKIIYFSKKLKIISEKEFLSNGYIIEKRNTKDSLGEGLIISPKINNTINGVQRYYNTRFSNKFSRKQFYIDGKLAGVIEVQKKGEQREESGLKILYKNTQDTLATYQSILVYDKYKNLVREKSFGYLVHGRDTIEKGEDYQFRLEFIPDKFNIDTVLFSLLLGKLTPYDFVLEHEDTLNGYKGFSRNYNIKLKGDTFQIGYQFVTGRIQAFGLVNNTPKYFREILFFHDFYVKPRETWLEIRNRNHPEYIETVKKAWAAPDKQDLWDKLDEEREEMNKEK